MNEQEIKKSIANRRAIYWKGEWDMICSCGECPMPYRTAEKQPQLQCMYYGGKDYDKKINIEDEGKVHVECGLPLWDRVRWHTADEVPEERKDLYVKIDRDGVDVFEPGYYWEGAFRNHYTGDRMVSKYSKIKSWRYLNA